MSYSVTLRHYQGPLDILLEMIEAEKLDISELALSQVTDGYLTYLDGHPGIAPEELADFLVVASKLLYLKSRVLLPALHDVGEGEHGLEDQLRIYKEYLDASKRLEALAALGGTLYVHERLPSVDIGFSPPVDFGGEDMRGMFAAVIRRLEPIVSVPKAVIERAVSIQERIARIRQLLRKPGSLSFRDVLADATTKTDIVVTFLALLELIKRRHVTVGQETRFSDILLQKA